MAALPGFRGQTNLIPSFRFDGSITSGSAPQLILPSEGPRASLSIQNTSAANMWLEFGPARAAATVSNGVVTSVAVTNAGFGYSYPPIIMFLGGGIHSNGLNLSSGYPGQKAPNNVARAHCVMTGTAPNMSIASIVVDNGGSGYSNDSRAAPYVQIMNSPNDVFGCAVPSVGVGYLLQSQAVFYESYSIVPTDQIAVFCATPGSTFVCRITT